MISLSAIRSHVTFLAGFVALCAVGVYYFLHEEDQDTHIAKMEDNTTAKAETLFSKFWEWRLRESPEFATCVGCHDFDDQLESYSLERLEARKLTAQNFLAEAKELATNFTGEDCVIRNLNLLVKEIEAFLSGTEVDGYFYPINFLEGVQVELERIVSYMHLENVADYKKLISRYNAFPQQAEEIILLMTEGIKKKKTNHAVSMHGVLKQFEDLQKPIENSPFYKPFLSIPNSISDDDKTMLQNEAKSAVSGKLLPAFERLAKFIAKEYMKVLRPEIAATSLPGGDKYYQQCLEFHTSTSLSPKEIHDIGLQEVSRISQEMDHVIGLLGMKMSRKQFSEHIRHDPKLFCDTSDNLLLAYKNLVEQVILPKIPQIIKDIPKMKMVVERMPVSMEEGPLAYYYAGSPNGSRPGTFFVNCADVNKSPKYEMMSLALHEGVPGHHLQASYMMELPNVPDFRRHVEDRKYSFAPSRFPLHTAHLEGWGLYSEFLGYELKLYEDPYVKFGHLSQEMFRACRLVVDTGMHALGWSREKAVQYMMDHTAATQDNIESEINRYITWPGQACAYKIGEIKIKTLRQKAEKSLGSKFNVQEFHSVVLQNTGPMSILEKEVDRYILNASS